VRFVARLVLGTLSVVAITLLVLFWGWPHSIVGAVTVALLVALALAWLAGRSIAGPLVALSQAAGAIAAGASPRFPRSGIPEVDTLVQALRSMHRDLADRFADVQREKAESTAIVDAMVEGVIASDARGRVVTANPAARRLLGYPGDGPLPDLPTLFRVKSAREAVDDVLAGIPVRDREIELDGQILSLNARPLPQSGAVLVLHDLTAIRRLEAVRRDFVANVSHELKTPLTSISGYAETLADPGLDAATRQRFTSTILTNARRMQRLVDDLLDLSRIESGRWTPRPEPIDVDAITTESWNSHESRAVARGVTLSREIAPDAVRLVADPEAVHHILGNLFDNAIRHVAPGGRVILRSVREDGGITVSVIDNGSGIPAEHLPRIFERFYRVDPARSRDEGGTGLGLAIVKHMVEAHGGRVSAASAPREGTTVSSWFPDATAGPTRIGPET
jgi:signal transduction histidine kinase